ncbi:MAG: hypothetical protein QG608_1894 [Actinomycetota bacterium]|nr:hypothetical protein [Actinomycetota bacterium]
MESTDDFFVEDRSYAGPPVREADVRRVEAELGVLLPDAYALLLEQRNGGIPKKRRIRTSFANSWADDHIEISAIKGIGGEWGIDSTSRTGSRLLIEEWGYPDIGIVICETPSGGHDVVMLDYSSRSRSNEPTVVYVDEDRVPRKIADSLRDFLDRLY